MSHYYMGMVRRSETPPYWLVKEGGKS